MVPVEVARERPRLQPAHDQDRADHVQAVQAQDREEQRAVRVGSPGERCRGVLVPLDRQEGERQDDRDRDPDPHPTDVAAFDAAFSPENRDAAPTSKTVAMPPSTRSGASTRGGGHVGARNRRNRYDATAVPNNVSSATMNSAMPHQPVERAPRGSTRATLIRAPRRASTSTLRSDRA